MTFKEMGHPVSWARLMAASGLVAVIYSNRQRDLPVRLVSHAGAPRAFDLFAGGEATREIIREILRFMQFHLVGPVLSDRPNERSHE